MCGESSSRESWEHDYQKNYVNLGEYTPCGGSFGVTNCGVCGEIFDRNYNIACALGECVTEKVTENGVEYEIATRTCSTCGMQVITTIWREEKSACVIVGHMSEVIVYNGEEIFSVAFSEEMAEHDYEYTYEMKGETCNDGYTLYETCKTCGDTKSSFRTYHTMQMTEVQFKEYGACGGGVKGEVCIVCGQQNGDAWFNCRFEYTEGENGEQIKTCQICGLQVVESSSREDITSCEYYMYYDRVVSMNGECIYSGVNKQFRVEHDYEYTYKMYGETCDDGYKLTYTCNNCGYSYSEESTCHQNSSTTIETPTCTQDGLSVNVCYICNQTTATYATNPYGHDWYYNGDGYTCSRCDMETANGADGSVVLEDLTVAYGEETNYVVGYWNQTEVDFTYYVSLILETGEEIILEGISFTEIEGVRAVAFSKAEVAEKATALGYEVGTYDVRFAFVPYGADSSFDYAVTFTS